ncbi:MAG TPA: fibronectin type III domain-containing protein [Candidatus Paceibacterota bacterium]|nr:fibronectin type III domain-containing protein [Candidatus Paceibacterota bacterium]
MKRILAILVLSALAAMLAPVSGFAANGSFTVGVDVVAVSDTAAPSVPTGVVAAALSSSQIEVDWNVSTDNVAVAGYHIYRNSILIATTTSTTFVDSGLSASTTYAYTVSAFDAAGNESAQSAGASTTTLAATVTPPTPPSGGSSGSSVAMLSIYDVAITAGTDSAIITWNTSFDSAATVSWGKTADAAQGAAGEAMSSRSHAMRIDNLEPGTRYFFRIDALGVNGSRATLGNLSVMTLANANEAPANVKDFTARQEGNGIRLSWQNPSDPDFDSVRIVKSDTFFPNDPQDGEVVYEGRAQDFKDTEVQDGATYYYAAFAKNKKGNYSSGAAASAIYSANGAIIPSNPLDNLPSSTIVDPKIEHLGLQDFQFIQDGQTDAFVDGTKVKIDGSKNLKISIDYAKVPEILKTIMVTLADPSDPEKTFSFILKVNKDKSAYEAVIAPLLKGGEYGVKISIIDYKNRGMKKLEGSLLAAAAEATGGPEPLQGDTLAMLLVIDIVKAFSLVAIIIGTLIEAILLTAKGKRQSNHAAHA